MMTKDEKDFVKGLLIGLLISVLLWIGILQWVW
jgi:hypothetical protein